VTTLPQASVSNQPPVQSTTNHHCWFAGRAVQVRALVLVLIRVSVQSEGGGLAVYAAAGAAGSRGERAQYRHRGERDRATRHSHAVALFVTGGGQHDGAIDGHVEAVAGCDLQALTR